MPESATLARRVCAALKTLFVADALAMPVHWYYKRADIYRQFPDGIRGFEAAPAHHPGSIMSLHSTSQGGRSHGSTKGREIVGEVILKGRREFWGQPNVHYHHAMQAGENTLNAHCARVLLRSLARHDGHYRRDAFLQDYIEFMTANPPRHGDTYAESYHRGFFANLEAGLASHRCGAVTHDTASIGGLVSIGPLALIERLRGTPLPEVQTLCREHLYLTHPDPALAQVCADYVALIDALLRRNERATHDILAEVATSSSEQDLAKLAARVRDDAEVIGKLYSPACYIAGAWPGVLYLAYRYAGDPEAGLIANANLGGDNVHRGAILGVLFGLMQEASIDRWFAELVDATAIEQEIVAACHAAGH